MKEKTRVKSLTVQATGNVDENANRPAVEITDNKRVVVRGPQKLRSGQPPVSHGTVSRSTKVDNARKSVAGQVSTSNRPIKVNQVNLIETNVSKPAKGNSKKKADSCNLDVPVAVVSKSGSVEDMDISFTSSSGFEEKLEPISACAAENISESLTNCGSSSKDEDVKAMLDENVPIQESSINQKSTKPTLKYKSRDNNSYIPMSSFARKGESVRGDDVTPDAADRRCLTGSKVRGLQVLSADSTLGTSKPNRKKPHGVDQPNGNQPSGIVSRKSKINAEKVQSAVTATRPTNDSKVGKNSRLPQKAVPHSTRQQEVDKKTNIVRSNRLLIDQNATGRAGYLGRHVADGKGAPLDNKVAGAFNPTVGVNSTKGELNTSYTRGAKDHGSGKVNISFLDRHKSNGLTMHIVPEDGESSSDKQSEGTAGLDGDCGDDNKSRIKVHYDRCVDESKSVAFNEAISDADRQIAMAVVSESFIGCRGNEVAGIIGDGDVSEVPGSGMEASDGCLYLDGERSSKCISGDFGQANLIEQVDQSKNIGGLLAVAERESTKIPSPVGKLMRAKNCGKIKPCTITTVKSKYAKPANETAQKNITKRAGNENTAAANVNKTGNLYDRDSNERRAAKISTKKCVSKDGQPVAGINRKSTLTNTLAIVSRTLKERKDAKSSEWNSYKPRQNEINKDPALIRCDSVARSIKCSGSVGTCGGGGAGVRDKSFSEDAVSSERLSVKNLVKGDATTKGDVKTKINNSRTIAAKSRSNTTKSAPLLDVSATKIQKQTRSENISRSKFVVDSAPKTSNSLNRGVKQKSLATSKGKDEERCGKKNVPGSINTQVDSRMRGLAEKSDANDTNGVIYTDVKSAGTRDVFAVGRGNSGKSTSVDGLTNTATIKLCNSSKSAVAKFGASPSKLPVISRSIIRSDTISIAKGSGRSHVGGAISEPSWKPGTTCMSDNGSSCSSVIHKPAARQSREIITNTDVSILDDEDEEKVRKSSFDITPALHSDVEYEEDREETVVNPYADVLSENLKTVRVDRISDQPCRNPEMQIPVKPTDKDILSNPPLDETATKQGMLARPMLRLPVFKKMRGDTPIYLRRGKSSIASLQNGGVRKVKSHLMCTTIRRSTIINVIVLNKFPILHGICVAYSDCGSSVYKKKTSLSRHGGKGKRIICERKYRPGVGEYSNMITEIEKGAKAEEISESYEVNTVDEAFSPVVLDVPIQKRAEQSIKSIELSDVTFSPSKIPAVNMPSLETTIDIKRNSGLMTGNVGFVGDVCDFCDIVDARLDQHLSTSCTTVHASTHNVVTSSLAIYATNYSGVDRVIPVDTPLSVDSSRESIGLCGGFRDSLSNIDTVRSTGIASNYGLYDVEETSAINHSIVGTEDETRSNHRDVTTYYQHDDIPAATETGELDLGVKPDAASETGVDCTLSEGEFIIGDLNRDFAEPVKCYIEQSVHDDRNESDYVAGVGERGPGLEEQVLEQVEAVENENVDDIYESDETICQSVEIDIVPTPFTSISDCGKQRCMTSQELPPGEGEYFDVKNNVDNDLSESDVLVESEEATRRAEQVAAEHKFVDLLNEFIEITEQPVGVTADSSFVDDCDELTDVIYECEEMGIGYACAEELGASSHFPDEIEALQSDIDGEYARVTVSYNLVGMASDLEDSTKSATLVGDSSNSSEPFRFSALPENSVGAHKLSTVEESKKVEHNSENRKVEHNSENNNEFKKITHEIRRPNTANDNLNADISPEGGSHVKALKAIIESPRLVRSLGAPRVVSNSRVAAIVSQFCSKFECRPSLALLNELSPRNKAKQQWRKSVKAVINGVKNGHYHNVVTQPLCEQTLTNHSSDNAESLEDVNDKVYPHDLGNICEGISLTGTNESLKSLGEHATDVQTCVNKQSARECKGEIIPVVDHVSGSSIDTNVNKTKVHDVDVDVSSAELINTYRGDDVANFTEECIEEPDCLLHAEDIDSLDGSCNLITVSDVSSENRQEGKKICEESSAHEVTLQQIVQDLQDSGSDDEFCPVDVKARVQYLNSKYSKNRKNESKRGVPSTLETRNDQVSLSESIAFDAIHYEVLDTNPVERDIEVSQSVSENDNEDGFYTNNESQNWSITSPCVKTCDRPNRFRGDNRGAFGSFTSVNAIEKQHDAIDLIENSSTISGTQDVFPSTSGTLKRNAESDTCNTNVQVYNEISKPHITPIIEAPETLDRVDVWDNTNVRNVTSLSLEKIDNRWSESSKYDNGDCSDKPVHNKIECIKKRHGNANGRLFSANTQPSLGQRDYGTSKETSNVTRYNVQHLKNRFERPIEVVRQNVNQEFENDTLVLEKRDELVSSVSVCTDKQDHMTVYSQSGSVDEDYKNVMERACKYVDKDLHNSENQSAVTECSLEMTDICENSKIINIVKENTAVSKEAYKIHSCDDVKNERTVDWVACDRNSTDNLISTHVSESEYAIPVTNSTKSVASPTRSAGKLMTFQANKFIVQATVQDLFPHLDRNLYMPKSDGSPNRHAIEIVSASPLITPMHTPKFNKAVRRVRDNDYDNVSMTSADSWISCDSDISGISRSSNEQLLDTTVCSKNYTNLQKSDTAMDFVSAESCTPPRFDGEVYRQSVDTISNRHDNHLYISDDFPAFSSTTVSSQDLYNLKSDSQRSSDREEDMRDFTDDARNSMSSVSDERSPYTTLKTPVPVYSHYQSSTLPRYRPPRSREPIYVKDLDSDLQSEHQDANAACTSTKKSQAHCHKPARIAPPKELLERPDYNSRRMRALNQSLTFPSTPQISGPDESSCDSECQPDGLSVDNPVTLDHYISESGCATYVRSQSCDDSIRSAASNVSSDESVRHFVLPRKYSFSSTTSDVLSPCNEAENESYSEQLNVTAIAAFDKLLDDSDFSVKTPKCHRNKSFKKAQCSGIYQSTQISPSSTIPETAAQVKYSGSGEALADNPAAKSGILKRMIRRHKSLNEKRSGKYLSASTENLVHHDPLFKLPSLKTLFRRGSRELMKAPASLLSNFRRGSRESLSSFTEESETAPIARFCVDSDIEKIPGSPQISLSFDERKKLRRSLTASDVIGPRRSYTSAISDENSMIIDDILSTDATSQSAEKSGSDTVSVTSTEISEISFDGSASVPPPLPSSLKPSPRRASHLATGRRHTVVESILDRRKQTSSPTQDNAKKREITTSYSNDSGIQHDSSLHSSNESFRVVSGGVARRPTKFRSERPKSDISPRWSQLFDEIWLKTQASDQEASSRPAEPQLADTGGFTPFKLSSTLRQQKRKQGHRLQTSVSLSSISGAPDMLKSLHEDVIAKTPVSRQMSTPHPVRTHSNRPTKQNFALKRKVRLQRSTSLPENLEKLRKRRRIASYFGFDAAGNYCSPDDYSDDSSNETNDTFCDVKSLSTRRTSQVNLSVSNESQYSYEENMNCAEALWDHITMDPEELGFRAGDEIEVTDQSDKDWWWGAINDREGWFPAAFVRLRVNQELPSESDVTPLEPSSRNVDIDGWRRHNAHSCSRRQARSNVVNEIMQAEREYVKHLKDVVEGYIVTARRQADMFTEERTTTIFGNLEEIFEFSSEFLFELEKAYDTREASLSEIGACFVNNARRFEIYSDYCNNHPRSGDELQVLYKNKKYRHFFEACRLLQDMIEIPLEGFLLTPIQKICKYPLQLSELLKYTDCEHADHANVCRALDAMKRIARLINERKRKIENIEKISTWQSTVENWEGADLLEHSSELIHSGEVQKVNSNGWAQDRSLFLFDHQLIYCKKDLLKRNVYVYKGRIGLDHCQVIPLNDGRDPQFNSTIRNAWKMYDKGRDRCFLFCARTHTDKLRWMKALRDERQLVMDDQENDIVIASKWKRPYRTSQKARSSFDKPKGKSGSSLPSRPYHHHPNLPSPVSKFHPEPTTKPNHQPSSTKKTWSLFSSGKKSKS